MNDLALVQPVVRSQDERAPFHIFSEIFRGMDLRARNMILDDRGGPGSIIFPGWQSRIHIHYMEPIPSGILDQRVLVGLSGKNSFPLRHGGKFILTGGLEKYRLGDRSDLTFNASRISRNAVLET